jgi:hypothetical protein
VSAPSGGPIGPERLFSVELERHLAFDATAGSGGHGERPYACATPFALQGALHDLLDRGWLPVPDPVTGALSAAAEPAAGDDVSTSVTCSSDVTSGIFETTVRPSASIDEVDRQQQELDTMLDGVLARRGLFLWCTETPSGTVVDREHYALYHTYWRGEYQMRRLRGEDHYWFAHTIGNNPCVDVGADEAVPFLEVVLRLTGATLFLRRFGSITGGGPDPDGRMTVRPSALGRLWTTSPHPQDTVRSDMLGAQFDGWAGYLRTLMGLPVTLLHTDNGPYIVDGDPRFDEMFCARPGRTFRLHGLDGRRVDRAGAGLRELAGLQRQVQFSRLRWTWRDGTRADELADALRGGDRATTDLMRDRLERCYLEIRSDPCTPPGEECVGLAFYAGLLENLDAVYEVVVRRRDRSFWRRLAAAAESAPVGSTVDGVAVPDLLSSLLDLAETGLLRRGRGEQRWLAPLRAQLDRLGGPAEDALSAFAEGGLDGVVRRHRVGAPTAFRPTTPAAPTAPARTEPHPVKGAP